jgi:hypothetical protein
MSDKQRNTGLDVNYYLVEVKQPKRLDPYTMEVEDIIEALDMTFAEGCVLKALIRRCQARKTGVIKANYDGPEYDAEKMVYYSGRVVAQDKRAAQSAPVGINDIRPGLTCVGCVHGAKSSNVEPCNSCWPASARNPLGTHFEPIPNSDK